MGGANGRAGIPQDKKLTDLGGVSVWLHIIDHQLTHTHTHVDANQKLFMINTIVDVWPELVRLTVPTNAK